MRLHGVLLQCMYHAAQLEDDSTPLIAASLMAADKVPGLCLLQLWPVRTDSSQLQLRMSGFVGISLKAVCPASCIVPHRIFLQLFLGVVASGVLHCSI